MNFQSIDDAKLWIIDHQVFKRNIPDFIKFELILEKEKILLEIGKEKQGQRTDLLPTIDKRSTGQKDTPKFSKDKIIEPIIEKKSRFEKNKKFVEKIEKSNKEDDIIIEDIIEQPDILQPEKKHDTREIIAKEIGWSTGKVGMTKRVKKEADKETLQKLRTGEVSINEVHNKIKKVEKEKNREKNIQKQKEDIETGKVKLPIGRFEIIVIDPPWPYGAKYDVSGRRSANPYPEMNINELKNIKLPASNDCVLWLWTTHKFIWDAKDLMTTWGFDYKAILTWNKEKIGMGYWLRMQTEFCLLGIKGKPIWNNTTERDIINETRRQHSRKPDKFYEMVEKICVGRKLDYFARKTKKGWDTVGNETNKF